MLFAAVDDSIFIEGVVGSFNKQTVKVYDSLEQMYELPRSIFPKNFRFYTGAFFNLEVDEKLFDTLDIKPSDKKIKIKLSLEK